MSGGVLVADDGRGWVPTWVNFYVADDGNKIACVHGDGFFKTVAMGTDLRWKKFHSKNAPPHPECGEYQPTGVAAGPNTRTIVLDADDLDAEGVTDSERAFLRSVATSVADDDSGRLHVKVIVPDSLMDKWPRQGHVRWGDLKSAGFCYDEGRNANRRYVPTGRPPLVATSQLMDYMLELNGGKLHETGGDTPDDSLDEMAATWNDPDGDWPPHIGEAVLGGDWTAGTRNGSLPRRCGIIKAAGERGAPGMRALFGELRAAYESATRRGSNLDRDFARAHPAWKKVDQLSQDAAMAGIPGLDPEKLAPSLPETVVADGSGQLAPDSPPPAPPGGRTRLLARASQIQPERVRWLWSDRLKLGGLALLAGREGLGKSTIALEIAARISRGTLDGEYLGAPRAVLIAATEDDWADTVAPRLIAAGADLDLVYQIRMTAETGGADELVLPWDTGHLAAAITETGAALVILDPLMSRLGAELDSHKDKEVRTALEPVIRMASDTGVTVLGLIHPNKSGSSDANNTVMGSRAFTALARSVLYATAHPDETAREHGHCVLFVSKNNLSPRAASGHAYVIAETELKERDPRDGSKITTGAVRWLGPLENVTLEMAMAAGTSSRRESAVDKAARWLTGYLAGHGGTADSGEAKADGAAGGHSERSLQRAVQGDGFAVENTSTVPRRTVWKLDSPQWCQTPRESPEVGATGDRRVSMAPLDLTDQGERGDLQSRQSRQNSTLPRAAGTTGATGAHYLSEVNRENGTGTCSRCGRVEVRVRKNGTAKCINARGGFSHLPDTPPAGDWADKLTDRQREIFRDIGALGDGD